MNYAFIKDGICINVAYFDDEEKALAFGSHLSESGVVDELIQIDDDFPFGIGDRYVDNTWVKNKIEIDIEEFRNAKIKDSKILLEEYLYLHPLLFEDGKYYSVTAEKQSLLNNAIAVYQLKLQAGFENPEIKWNATGEECTIWTIEELSSLALAIAAYVEPLIAKQQAIEVQIRECKTLDELMEIEINYGTDI